MKNSKSVLIRVAAMVCFFGFFAAHAQNLNLSVKIDPVKKEVVTYVNLTEIPTGVDIVWQQKIPKDAVCLSSFFQIRQNDDGSKMVTTTFSRNLLLSSKMSFSFSCTVDAIGDWIRWGETTLTYTTKKSKEQVVKFPAQVFIVAECLMDSVTPIAAQKPQPANDLGEKAKLANAAEVKQEVVKVEENPYIHQSTDQIIVLQVPEKVVMMQEAEQVIVKQEPEQIIVKQEPERVVVKQEPEQVIVKQEPEQVVVKQEPEQVIVKQEPEQVVVKQEPERVIVKQEPEQVIVKQEPEQVIVKQEPEQIVAKQEPEQIVVKQEPERVIVKQEPEQPVVKQEPAKPPVQQAPVNQEVAKPQSGYYIQVSCLSKSNLAGIKKDIPTLKGDNVIEVRRDKLFIYYIGPFPTEKEASDRLKQHYVKYVPDAMIRKL